MAQELILLAEDHEPTRRLYTQMLAAKAYRVLATFSGIEVLKLLERNKPSLILLDIMMPGMDGITTCLQIREKYGVALPVVFLSALNESDTLRKALEAGGNDYIIKSGDMAGLLARVKFWSSPRDPAMAQLRHEVALDSVAKSLTRRA